MKRFLVSLAITLVVTLIAAVIYPAVRGAAARSPDDTLGNAIFSALVPVTFLLSFYGLHHLDQRRK